MHEFRCFFCTGNADRIAYYSKDYPSGKSTIENPHLICPECYKNSSVRDQIHQHRGGIEGISNFSFGFISSLPKKKIGYIISSKFHETNHLANKFWRKQIFRIHYTHQPKREIADVPNVSRPVL